MKLQLNTNKFISVSIYKITKQFWKDLTPTGEKKSV